MKSFTEVMHCAPKLIKEYIELDIVGAPLPASVQGDVYALGCMIYQLVHRLSLHDVVDESGVAISPRKQW